MADDFTPLRVVVLTSRSAPGLAQLLADPNRGTVYELTAVVSSEPSFTEMKAVEEAGVSVLLRPMREFFAEHHLSLRNLQDRTGYDEQLAGLARDLQADYLVLDGYNYIVSAPLLEEFPMRILALHDGDLTLRDEEGRRRYAGLHAVRDALFDGEFETRSSAFFVTAEVGEGPLFLLSGPFPVPALGVDARNAGDAATLSSYAELHRRWMVGHTWGRMLTRGLEFLAAGSVQVIHDLVWIDGVPGPCRMGDSPSLCQKLKPLIDSRIPSSCPLIKD